jgi:hypothetical protein
MLNIGIDRRSINEQGAPSLFCGNIGALCPVDARLPDRWGGGFAVTDDWAVIVPDSAVDVPIIRNGRHNDLVFCARLLDFPDWDDDIH